MHAELESHRHQGIQAQETHLLVRVREFFSVVPDGQLDVDMPLTIELDAGINAAFERQDDASLRLVIERPIDPLVLTVEQNSGIHERRPRGTEREIPALRVPGNENIQAIDLTAALTFLTDVPLKVSRPFPPSELIAESAEDIAALDAFGTRQVYAESRALLAIRTFQPIVDADAIRALIPRTVGLRLYADAIALNSDVATYRELWRILESAFGLQDKPLVDALATYAPARELGFDREELHALMVLRGKASHAATKGGLAEILRVGDLTSERRDRLKCLVERVILTKKTWGARSGGLQELTPARSWVGRDGQIVLRRLASS